MSATWRRRSARRTGSSCFGYSHRSPDRVSCSGANDLSTMPSSTRRLGRTLRSPALLDLPLDVVEPDLRLLIHALDLLGAGGRGTAGVVEMPCVSGGIADPLKSVAN